MWFLLLTARKKYCPWDVLTKLSNIRFIMGLGVERKLKSSWLSHKLSVNARETLPKNISDPKVSCMECIHSSGGNRRLGKLASASAEETYVKRFLSTAKGLKEARRTRLGVSRVNNSGVLRVAAVHESVQSILSKAKASRTRTVPLYFAWRGTSR